MDNYATHKTQAVQRFLARHPRWHVHFTPTGASWLNQVERFFALLTEKQLRRGVHRSTEELEAAIEHYIASVNKDPRPFRWTKSADDILATIKRFCLRTLETAARQNIINKTFNQRPISLPIDRTHSGKAWLFDRHVCVPPQSSTKERRLAFWMNPLHSISAPYPSLSITPLYANTLASNLFATSLAAAASSFATALAGATGVMVFPSPTMVCLLFAA